MHRIYMLLLIPLVFRCQEPAKKTLEDVANFYGVKAFHDVKEISFTFNVKKSDDTVSRSWKWRPKENTVLFVAKKGNTGYNRSTITSEEMLLLDQQFINDSYWLLFPFHLVWDEGLTCELQEDVSSPIRNEHVNKLILTYEDIGYSHGDIYELYIDHRGKIKEWIYRKAGSANPTRITTWESNQRFESLLISTDHKGKDNLFRVWFTDLSIKWKN